MKLLHVSLTARDANALSSFYEEVFGCVHRRSPKRLSGEHISRGNGLLSSDIYSIWLKFPGDDGPFLEIMEYDTSTNRRRPEVNEPGFSHLAFEVQNLNGTIEKVLRLGGALQGQITNLGTEDTPLLILYIRDPEGNILELEQA